LILEGGKIQKMIKIKPYKKIHKLLFCIRIASNYRKLSGASLGVIIAAAWCFIGIIATVWHLRVIFKPSRAAYPCAKELRDLWLMTS